MAVFTLAALKSELQNDPAALGLTAPFNTGADGVCVSLLNAVSQSIQVKRNDIAPSEILEAIDSRDFAASPSVALCSWFESLTQLKFVRLVNDDGSTTKVQGNLGRLVTSDTNGSQARLTAIGARTGSRAEQLWGPGFQVTALNVSDARAA